MKVSKDNPLLQEQQRLNRKLKSTNIAKAAELGNVRHLYGKKLKAAKIEGEREIFEAKRIKLDNINKAREGQQKKLQEFQQSLKDYGKFIESERGKLDSDNANRIKDQNSSFAAKMQLKIDQAKMETEKIGTKTNDAILDMQLDSSRTRNDVNLKNKIKLDNANYAHDVKTANITAANKKESKNLNMQFLESVAKQKMENNKKMLRLELDNQHEFSTRSMIHQIEVDKKEQQNKQLLRQADVSFKKKYTALQEAHKSLIDGMKIRFDEEISNAVSAHAQKKTLIAQKGSDPFYNLNKLNTTIVDGLKEYTVTLAVPEYEKDNYQITPSLRTLRVSMSRRYTDKMIAPTGIEFSSKRSEVVSKQFSTKDIMDPSKVTQKYENGVLTFKIAKL